MTTPWYRRSYRRMLWDFHISDWSEQFLSRWDPREFAECVKAADMTAATIMANTHTGLCNYPTKVGAVHPRWKGIDAIGETIRECRARGIDVVLYYCTIYCDWYWETHPAARIVDADGRSEKLLMGSLGLPRRFSVSCPNNPGYRRFVEAQLTELCERYEFEGVWPDMTFWPTVCYCPSCRERYAREVGGDIPRVIDWRDPAWVRFQRKRQEWLGEFVHLVTSTIKRHKPACTVAHQSHTFHGDWLFGASSAMAADSDWLSADLYGERYHLAFFSKLFHGMSRVKPFEHLETWAWPNIHEHVITRTESELRATVFATFMNDGAMAFIDAVDPVGTVHRRSFETVGRIFRELESYEPHMGGSPAQEVGIYYSFDSTFDMATENGRPVSEARYVFEPGRKGPHPSCHRSAAISLGTTLAQHHVPWGVVTRTDLGRLAGYQLLVLPNAVMLDDEEAAALKAYVEGGGCLYASKNTSILRSDGKGTGDFLLSDLFGVSYEGETSEILTYCAPVAGREDLFAPFGPDWPITVNDTMLLVRPHAGAEILATVTLPYTDPKGTRYASILTDPPGRPTSWPALVMNRFGSGRVIYSAGVLEMGRHDSQRQVVANLVKLLAARPFAFAADAPKAVDVTLFHQPERKRWIVNLLNYQQELPNVPVTEARARVLVGRMKPKSLSVLPAGTPIPWKLVEGYVEFAVPRLVDYLMLELAYE